MITGYTSQLTSCPGSTVSAFVTSDETKYDVRTVKLLGGAAPGQPHKPLTIPQPSAVDGSYRGRVQRTVPGSYVVTEPFSWPFANTFAMATWIYVTLTGRGCTQAIASVNAHGEPVIELALVDDELALFFGENSSPVLTGSRPLRRNSWTRVVLNLGPDGLARLSQEEIGAGCGPVAVGCTVPELPLSRNDEVSVLFAASCDKAGPRHFLNGRMASPSLSAGPQPTDGGGARPRTVLSWDFGADPWSMSVPSTGSQAVAARCVNAPERAVPGPAWDGRWVKAADAPEHYDAIYFHEDDLDDARWTSDFALEISPEFTSGVYAFHLSSAKGEDYLPFVVTDPVGQPSAEVLVVLPTWTYIAYANWRTYAEDPDGRAAYFGEYRAPTAEDIMMRDHPEFGLCFYDTHVDGSLVSHSSRLRPVLNLRPLYKAAHANGYRHLSSDLQLLRWLDERGVPYATATDDDLQHHGAALLNDFKVVMTGSHPEYASLRMLDAYQSFIVTGGRLIYLGGNGFYWVTAAHRELSYLLESRRGHNGIRRKDTAPGQEFHGFTGEYGGLWRYRGRPPHALTGVGCIAQGFDKAAGYVRSEESYDPCVSWVFDGVEGRTFGSGVGPLGGAAGDEIDSADKDLGTPEGTVVLASSTRHSDKYLLSIENIPHLVPCHEYGGPDNELIRSDLVLVPVCDEYRVFSVGSIAWINAMTSDSGDALSRITENVLRRFLL